METMEEVEDMLFAEKDGKCIELTVQKVSRLFGTASQMKRVFL